MGTLVARWGRAGPLWAAGAPAPPPPRAPGGWRCPACPRSHVPRQRSPACSPFPQGPPGCFSVSLAEWAPAGPLPGPGSEHVEGYPSHPCSDPTGGQPPTHPRPPRCAPLSLLSSPSLSHSTGRGAPRGRVSDFQTCSPGARARGPKQRSAAGSPSGFSDGTGVTVPWSHVGGVSPRTVHRLGVQTQTQGRDSPGGLSHEERQPRPPGPLPCRE